MSETEIYLEYEDRLQRSGMYGVIAVLLFSLSIVVLAASFYYRDNVEFWGGLLLPAGIIFLVLAIALAVLSAITLRCTNCYRILGGIHTAAYCPACGTRLIEGETRALENIPGDEPADGAEDFPEEKYPKDIRMFTTPDETELTKRFIRLIRKDEETAPDEEEEPEIEFEETDETADEDARPESDDEDTGEDAGFDDDAEDTGEDEGSENEFMENGEDQRPLWRINQDKNQSGEVGLLLELFRLFFRINR